MDVEIGGVETVDGDSVVVEIGGVDTASGQVPNWDIILR